MKFTLTSLAFLIIAVSVSGCQGKGKIFDEAIRNLDRTIADEKAILRLKESRADSLRRECRSSADAASRFLTVKALYEEYSRYDIDSAFYYVHLNREIAGKSGKPEMIFDADLDLADRYRISGMFNDALEVVDTMDNLTINHTIHLQRGRVLVKNSAKLTLNQRVINLGKTWVFCVYSS